jgi:isoleucyl-tRNA synthetase
MVWTTTPWTLVSNVALAVHPELTYAELRKKSATDWTIMLAEARVPGVLGNDYTDRWDVVDTHRGAELVGLRYKRPLDWVAYPEEGRHEVIVAEEFVSAEDGSGVVHMAPAFGADDYAAGQRHGLAFRAPGDARGEFSADVPEVGAVFVKQADARIIEVLREQDQLWKAAEVHTQLSALLALRHTAAVLRAWVVVRAHHRVQGAMMLARNAAVNWNPPRWGRALWRMAREQRRLGDLARPLLGHAAAGVGQRRDPTEVEVIGQLRRARRAHRARRCPRTSIRTSRTSTQYTWPAPSGRGTMRRVPEVIDTWFDSGSMPFAQWHFPFEKTTSWRRRTIRPTTSPRAWTRRVAGSIRCWRSPPDSATRCPTMHAGTAASPYRNVVVNDLVLDATGQKMSKSKGNVVNPWEVLSRHGADAVRLFLVASSSGVGAAPVR